MKINKEVVQGLAVLMCLAVVGAVITPTVVQAAPIFAYYHNGLGAAGMTLTVQNVLWLTLKVGGELAAEEVISTTALCVACGAALIGFGFFIA